ncbi:chorismate synthase [bacterium BMS3Abin10]|nr:chorismate synthase [bacterium BMS3Abin10]GBE38906.1 chorismate synthase [bacterium BMS3Bbin08]
MSKIRFLTSGESHGKGLAGILEGIPAGLSIASGDVNKELSRRQKGHGRGGRMKIESDTVQILSGVRRGKTLGSPICLLIENRDWKNWAEIMSPEIESSKVQLVTRPRPGHADLAGALKYDQKDIRNILERSSARETAMRVALGAVAKRFLDEFKIRIGSFVTEIGSIEAHSSKLTLQTTGGQAVHSSEKKLIETFEKAERSSVRCPDKKAEKEMVRSIDRAKKQGNSLGGVFEVFAIGLPSGLGSHIQWDTRLESRISQAVMGIQAIKGIEIGCSAFEMARKPGSEVMDEIFFKKGTGFYRKTNHAGGIEGGMSNGMPLIIRAAMKPIPTQGKPLKSVDIRTKKLRQAAYERSDICAVPAAAVIAEAMVALVLADSFLEKFGGDSMKEVARNYKGYVKQIKEF